MNYIIGSGLIGLIARKLLGDKWRLISQKKSRYFSFLPALADNYIVFDKNIDDFVKTLSPLASRNMLSYKRSFSYAGQLLSSENEMTTTPYLHKIYGENVPTLAAKSIRTSFFTYHITPQELYEELVEKNINHDDDFIQSQVVGIDIKERKIRIEENNLVSEFDYDKIICTAPLDALVKWTKQNLELESKPICYYHIRTDKIDSEGANEILICDHDILFFKATMIDKGLWMFWAFDDIDNPHNYFGQFLDYQLDILEVTRVNDAMPLGEPPDLSVLEANDIYCVGSNAQWDDLMDVSSCINRLLRLSKRLS
jgi:hypothetical protein